MKIHRLRLEHVKGVTATELTFPDAGVVIIEGPNEVGKSTLLEALDRLLDPKAKASSKAASIVSMQPVGQDVGPYVEAELSIGPYRLVFAKRWLKQPATTLQILKPAPEQLTGQDAQARMSTILDECLDRTLFDALRLTQAGSPGAIALGNSAVLEAALDAAAGADLHADEGSALLEAAEREYLRYYTAGTGRVSGELREAQTAVTEGEDLHERAEYDIREVEALFQRREILDQDLATGEQWQHSASVRALAADAALAQVRELRAREEVAAQAEAAAERSHCQVLKDVLAREALADEAATRLAEVQRRQDQIEPLESARDQRAGELLAREKDLDIANGDCAKAQDEADVASKLLSSLRSHVEVAALADRIAAAESITAALEQSRADVEACAISASVLTDLRRIDAEVNVAQARVEASATAVRVSAPELGHSVEIEEESLNVDPGRAVIERLILTDVSLVVDSCVRIDIRPDTLARERMERRDTLRDLLAERLALLGLLDLAEAEQAAQRRADAVTATARFERDLAQALQGSELADVRDAHALQAAALDTPLESLENGASRVGEYSSASAPGELAVAERSDMLARAAEHAEEIRRRLPHLGHVRSSAQQAADGARAQHAQAGAALEVMQARFCSASAEQARAAAGLADARVVDSDEEVSENAHLAKVLLDKAHAALREIRAALAAHGAAAREDEASQAATELSRARAHLRSLREEFFETKGRLEQVTAEGRQEAFERAGQALDDARRRNASVTRRAAAAALLHATLQRHRDRAHQSYAEPYAHHIERLGQQIYGDSFGVTVSRELVITHRRLYGDVVPFESLSGGAKEQLGILARLAVAALVANRQSVPVVVDDALGYTDPQRLRSLGTVLAHGGSEGQLLLLTCTPERYADIPGAHTIAMTA